MPTTAALITRRDRRLTPETTAEAITNEVVVAIAPATGTTAIV